MVVPVTTLPSLRQRRSFSLFPFYGFRSTTSVSDIRRRRLFIYVHIPSPSSSLGIPSALPGYCQLRSFRFSSSVAAVHPSSIFRSSCPSSPSFSSAPLVLVRHEAKGFNYKCSDDLSYRSLKAMGGAGVSSEAVNTTSLPITGRP
ncbi:hypothetical protein PIB30_091028 [Stylosanthes scabra]|uniref:Uncharacterized protein n=1 Tax=Stylosanthes scabra TaxID=79078 RepID=A0ABU6XTT2_9FABA|nr:hypothetical protein [Stylosanthes scabra]